jgi:hypothetical protein
MNRFLATTMCLVLITGCGGRTPAPVMTAQYGDTQKSCQALEYEIANTQGEMNRLLPQADKTGKNVALGVAGAFLLVPWFFMDFKGAEQTEYEAHRQRYNNLASVAMSKGCDVRPQHYPTAEELRQQHEQQNRTTTSNPRSRR